LFRQQQYQQDKILYLEIRVVTSDFKHRKQLYYPVTYCIITQSHLPPVSLVLIYSNVDLSCRNGFHRQIHIWEL